MTSLRVVVADRELVLRDGTRAA
eukprot:COSAG02_NODE_47003_length_344_cov_0.844898_2_plen_22_part_01